MFDEEKLKKKFSRFFLIFISILAIGAVKKGFQNDTFYTIKIGELILNNGIDMLDHFSFHTNLLYTYPHWLYDVFIYIIYKFFGFLGIYFSSIILFIILLMVVFKTNKRVCGNVLISAFTTFICLLAISGFVTARAQLVSFILFALEIYFIESFLRNNKKKYLFGLLLISLLLCNIHVAVWPFYFIIYIPFIVEYIIAKITKKNKFLNIEIKKNDNVKKLVIIMFISLLAGFLTPIKDTPFTYLLNTMQGSSQSYIEEHLPPSILGKISLTIFSIIIINLIILGKIKLHNLFLILGLTIMAYTSVRHMSLYTIFILPIISSLVDNTFNKHKINIDKYTIKYICSKLGIILISIILISLLCISIYINKDKEFVNHKVYPIKATEYIKENLDYKNIRIFNEYNYGSYLLLNDIKVFIDSRADLYTKEFNKKEDILKEYMSSNYQNIFDKYEITHVIASKNDILYNYTKNMNYKIIYEDDYFVIYELINNI